MISATPKLSVFHSSQRTENLSGLIPGTEKCPCVPAQLPTIISYMEISYMPVSSIHIGPFSGSKAGQRCFENN